MPSTSPNQQNSYMHVARTDVGQIQEESGFNFGKPELVVTAIIAIYAEALLHEQLLPYVLPPFSEF